VAIPIQLLLAKDARPAGDIERHQNVVADLQLLHVLAELLHHAGELVAERHPHPGIRYRAVVQMQIGPADTLSRDPDNGVPRMQDLRRGFMVEADPVRSTVIHGKHRSGSFLLALVLSSTSTSSRLKSSSTVSVSSTTRAELRLLACGWRFESVHRGLRLRRGYAGYS
jgi:hypothetical protein